ncbi:MAG TPA: hypothetical protein VGA21_09015 [Cyclobacteriaceae bacterium]
MMRLLTFVFIFICSQHFVVAQNKYHDVIRLKNGSIIKGTIIERKPNESVTILIGGRESITFFEEEISRIDKEGRLKFRDSPHRKGYFTRTEMGASIRKNHEFQGSYHTILPWFQTIHGYKWNRYLETGAGLGTDFYESVITVPFFIHVSGELLNSKVTPIYLIQYGDSFILNGKQIQLWNDPDVEAKNFFRIATGFQVKNPANAFYITAGFKLNKVVYKDDPWWWDSATTITTRLYRSFTFGFGMKF